MKFACVASIWSRSLACRHWLLESYRPCSTETPRCTKEALSPLPFVTTMESSRDITPQKSIFGGPPTSAVQDDGVEADSDSNQATPHYSSAATPTTPAGLANKNVAPFLAKHIPGQYAPLGSRDSELYELSKANSKYCYRHRPDLKCRRQADEPSMDKLQRVCFFSPVLASWG